MKYNRNKRGSIVLKDGTTITQKEYNKFRNNVYKANKKREKLLNYYLGNDIKGMHISTGISDEVFIADLENRGILPRKQSYALKGVNTKEEKQRKLKNMGKIANTKYTENKIKNVRKRMYEQIRSRLGKDSANKVIHRISRLEDNKFLALYLTDDNLVRELFYNTLEDDEFEEFTKSRIELAFKKIGE